MPPKEHEKPSLQLPAKDQIQSFITKDETAAAMVHWADKLGHHLKESDVKTSQIRNAYGTMKKLEMAGWQGGKTQREILLLKPRLAYAAGRQSGNAKNGLQKLKEALDPSIEAVSDSASFKRFCQFFEAIIAYHKAAGGS